MILLLAGLALARAPADLDEDVAWEVLLEGDTWVGCAPLGNDTWCRSRTLIPHPLDEVEAVLTDFANYPAVFDRITSTTMLAPDAVHVVLDMPFPLAQRDYIARFARTTQGEVVVWGWVPDASLGVPVGKAVRLDRSQGDWRLEPAPGGTTLTYTWNGALGGDIPKWALPRAWRTQGAEVMVWLQDAMD